MFGKLVLASPAGRSGWFRSGARCFSGRYDDLTNGGEDAPQTSMVSFTEPRLPAVQSWTNSVVDAPSEISGDPPEHVAGRHVRIFMPAKAAPQSATGDTHVWKIEVDTRKRWESPLIGWCSNADPLSNIAMALQFHSAEAAADFCKRKGWSYEIVKPQIVNIRPKSYALMTADQKSRKSVSTKPTTIGMVLNENSQLISSIVAYQNRGKPQEAERYQQALHRNLLQLAQMASNSGHPEFLAKLQAPFESADGDQTNKFPAMVDSNSAASRGMAQQQPEMKSPMVDGKMRNKEGVMHNYAELNPQGSNITNNGMVQMQMSQGYGHQNASALQQQLQSPQAMYGQHGNMPYGQEQLHRQQMYNQQQQQQQQQQQYAQMIRPNGGANDGGYYGVNASPAFQRSQYPVQHHEHQFSYQNPSGQSSPMPNQAYLPPPQQQQPRQDAYGQPLTYDAVAQRQYGNGPMMTVPINQSPGQPMAYHQSPMYHQTYPQQNTNTADYSQD